MLRLIGIGALGNMLSPAALHLTKKNSKVRFTKIYDRKGKGTDKQQRREQWLAHGAKLVGSYEELISDSHLDGIVICAGKNGDDVLILAQLIPLIESIFKGQQKPFIIHHSTVSTNFVVAASKACEIYQIPYANYPLTGGAKGANAGTMLILASGPRQLYDKVLPYLEAIGQPRYFDNDVATAAKVKLLSHVMVFNGLFGISSAVSAQLKSIGFQGQAEVDLFDFLNQGAGGTRQWDVAVKQAVANNDWTSGFLLIHAVIDAIYTANFLLEIELPKFTVTPVLHLAGVFSYLLNSYPDHMGGTQTVLKVLLENPKKIDAFIDSIEDKDPSKMLVNVIKSLPEPLQDKVKLQIGPGEFTKSS